ncbi:MAG: ErfK/YbiS/YcfS/YnhG family protein, partial [uncultured Friedmanniella sp.]
GAQHPHAADRPRRNRPARHRRGRLRHPARRPGQRDVLLPAQRSQRAREQRVSQPQPKPDHTPCHLVGQRHRRGQQGEGRHAGQGEGRGRHGAEGQALLPRRGREGNADQGHRGRQSQQERGGLGGRGAAGAVGGLHVDRHRSERGRPAHDLQDHLPDREAHSRRADLPQPVPAAGQPGRGRHADRAHLRRAGHRQGGVREESARHVHSEAAGQLELVVPHPGPVPSPAVLEARDQGAGARGPERRRCGERDLRPDLGLDLVHRRALHGHPDRPGQGRGDGPPERPEGPDDPGLRRQARLGDAQRDQADHGQGVQQEDDQRDDRGQGGLHPGREVRVAHHQLRGVPALRPLERRTPGPPQRQPRLRRDDRSGLGMAVPELPDRRPGDHHRYLAWAGAGQRLRRLGHLLRPVRRGVRAV